MGFARKVANRIIFMDDGQIVEENDPENFPVPDYEEKISGDVNIGHFIHLCLIRAMREDRTVLASN